MKQYEHPYRGHGDHCGCDACRRACEKAAPTWECKASEDGCGVTCKPTPPVAYCPPKPMPKPPRPPKPPCPPASYCDGCRCEEGCQPACKRKPFPPHGFLLPRIIASAREWLRRTRVELQVSGLSPCAEPPFTLMSVAQGCDTPLWEPIECGDHRQMRLHLRIPVLCQVRDKNGCCYTGHAVLEMDAALRLSIPAGECWRNAMVVLPCVRLVCVPSTQCEPCFDAQLEVLVEVYMTRWEPCMVGVPKPVCPDLPLYPQPRLE